MAKMTAKETVALAKKEIGTKESPANSNKVKYWNWYKKRTGLNLNGSPWCACFVSYIMCQAGIWSVTTDKAMFRYCPSMVEWAKNKRLWLGRTKKVLPGDIVIFANSSNVACHVGIVIESISDTEIRTVEGNTGASSWDNGGNVLERVRNINTSGFKVLGYIRPKYKTSSTSTTTTTTTTSKSYNAVITAKSGLNVRKAASTSSRVLDTIPYNTSIKIIAEKNGWGKTTYDGKTGWVYLQYVKKK